MALGSAARLRYQELANRYRTRVPGQHGLRQWRVWFRSSTSSGSHIGDGTVTETETEILENGYPPKVTEQRSTTVILADEATDAAVFEIGPMTQVVGTAWASLSASSLDTYDQWQLRLQHVETGENVICRIDHISKDKALHTSILCSSVRLDT